MSGLTEVLFIDRCLNLLKPGGRLGIVLPEGVLNNTNLQNVREYFEGRAKILLIVSIPQDVFMAAGATVKPSLMFFKRFTEEEQAQYNGIKVKAFAEVQDKYIEELTSIENELAKRGKEALPAAEKKKLRARKKEIETAIEQETKTLVKQRFDYVIPIADIKRAGINSIGIKIENDLEPLLEEFTKYRKENNLWDTRHANTSYQYNDGSMTRIREFDGMVGEPEAFYGKDQHDMVKMTYKFLHLVNYKDIPNWSVQYADDEDLGFTKKYQMARIGSFLTRRKEAIDIQDGIIYKRVTVSTKGGNITIRDEKDGKLIGTSNPQPY